MSSEELEAKKAQLEKMKWVEEQVNRNLDFGIDCRDLLRGEAHRTLQWLFAIILGASGFVVSLVRPENGAALQLSTLPWWLIVPLVIVVIGAAATAIYLLHQMRTAPVPAKGNEPKNLATESYLGQDEFTMRWAEVLGLQQRLEENREASKRFGRAINASRYAIVLVIPLAFVVSAPWFSFIALALWWWVAA
jgi:hypothetical protein